MNINELIIKLQAIATEHGDLEVMVADWEYMNLQPTSEVGIVRRVNAKVLVIADVDPTKVDWN